MLFLANSALSSFRLLYHSGISNQNSQLLYSSLIFLPLATEYFMKYLLVKGTGTFEKKYRIHKQLTLFDFLPPDIQESIENEFKNELENIGRPREYQALRVFLKRSQNAFTAIRYLFDPANAETSKHLLEPENTAILTCLSSALERVSKGYKLRPLADVLVLDIASPSLSEQGPFEYRIMVFLDADVSSRAAAAK